jgi:hypothetical protein
VATGRNGISIAATQAYSLDYLDTYGSALRLWGSLAKPDPPRLWRRELGEIVTLAMARPILDDSVVPTTGSASWSSALRASASERMIG